MTQRLLSSWVSPVYMSQQQADPAEDDDYVESVMDGKKYMASRLATTWRRTLMRGKLPVIH